MVINLKKLNTFISYEHFKMEGLHCLKFLPEQNDFMCKISQRRLLLNSFQQAIIKICEIQVVKQPLRVYLPLFWFRTNSTSFHQITKNLNNNCLSRRYVTDEVDLTRSCDSEGCIDFSAAKFGVSHESGIVNSSTSEANGIYGVADKCRGNDIVSNNRN